MAIDLLPLPVSPDLPEVPTDPEQMREWLVDLRKRYNTMYGILRQDINRLATPPPAAKAPKEDPLGHGIAYNLLNDWPVNLAVSSLKKELQLANGADRGKVNITFKYLGVGDVVIGSGANVTYTADLATSPVASGGTVDTTTVPGYAIHVFNASGNLVVSTPITGAEILVVAGGGGGGGNVGGGGGAGGYRNITGLSIAAGTHAITVGAGGAGGTGAGGNGAAGSDSVALTYTSLGGGGGRGFNGSAPAVGGSGGGGSDSDAGIAGTAGQGNDGGAGWTRTAGDTYAGGGGGGASAAGAAGTSGQGGAGGAGTSSTISGAAVTRGGGGGGGGYQTPTSQPGAGGAGGGGAGDADINQNGADGTANTGGGGGGGAGGGSGAGGAGGSGVVIIKYPIPPPQPNGLDVGPEAASTWYYVYMIVGEDGPEVTDNTANNLQPPIWRRGAKVASLLSTSATPALPPGFNRYRRVGMVRNNSSSDLYRFTNAVDDDMFWWNEDVSTGDFLVLNVTTSVITYTDVSCAAVVAPTSREMILHVQGNDTAGTRAIWFRNNDHANIAAANVIADVFYGAADTVGAGPITLGCDSAQVVEYRTAATTTDVVAAVRAYRDIR